MTTQNTNNIKINSLVILIILCSILSGTIGSYVFLRYINPELNNIITKIETRDIVKENKNISITDLQSEVTKLVKKAGPSVVSIIIKKDLDLYKSDPWGFFAEKVGSIEKKVGGGSGFFISKDGYIMTNKHVVSDPEAKYTVITSDGSEYEAGIIATDKLTDLAILKINSTKTDFPILYATNNENINIGQFVIAIGNALAEFQNSVSFGVISGSNRSIEAGGFNFSEKLSGLLQTDAAINPGNSGGPLLDLDGKVIGINTAIAGDSQGLGFSIPLTKKRIDYIIGSIKKYGEIKRPFIGINYVAIDNQIAAKLGLKSTYGAYISSEDSILENSEAKKSGIKSGDIILEIDGQKITTTNTISDIIQNKIPGDTINLKVLKENSKVESLNLVLGEN